MGLFGFGKKGGDVIDLAERFRKKREMDEQNISSESAKNLSSDSIMFFDSPSSSSDNNSGVVDLSNSSDDKRKRLAKRILEITNKLEDISNQIYHLQQRIEVLERRADTRL